MEPRHDRDMVDEQKVMLGFDSEAEAVAAYLAHYNDCRFLGDVDRMPMDEFKRKVIGSSGEMIKGGDGSGNFGHKGRPGEVGGSAHAEGNDVSFPSSAHVSSLDEAKKYFDDHLAGVWSIVTKRKAGMFEIKVNLKENEEHAYSKDFGGDGERGFHVERARHMDKLIPAIANPGIILQNGNRDLFVARKFGDDVYAVVLEWRQSEREYRFRSAHIWSKDELNKNIGKYGRPPVRGVRVKNYKTPERLNKAAGALLAFTNLPRYAHPSGLGQAPADGGIHWPDYHSMGLLSNLVKSTGDWVEIDPGETELIMKALGEGERWITVTPPGH